MPSAKRSADARHLRHPREAPAADVDASLIPEPASADSAAPEAEPPAPPAPAAPAKFPVLAPKKEGATAVPVMKKPKKAEGKIAVFLTSINYIGMGKEQMMFTQNLATLLNAGLPLVESLRTLHMEAKNKTMKKIVQRIVDAVESGSTLWSAMDEQHLFTPYAIALIRIGEEAGNLAQNMEYLSEQQEKDAALKQKVKMAMIYPAIVLVLIFIMVMGLGLFVLPNLVNVLFALNAELPLATRMLITVANFFTNHGMLAVGGSFGAIIGLFTATALLAPVRRVMQWMMFKVPGIGRLAREATIARFGVILGGLLRAGVPLVESMRSLVEVTSVLAYKDLYAKLLENITVGQSFQKSFADVKGSHRLLPVSVQSLVVVGEKSGTLSQVLMKISDIYDRKATDTAQKLPIVLEPMLLIFIGGLVGFIAFAIIMPIYSVVGNIG